MKQGMEKMKDVLKQIDEIYDPENKLNDVLAKAKPKLALEITPTKRHDPCHDLFRIYTFKLLRDLSRKFELILIYRDLQATIDLSSEESKKSIQENISMLHNSKVPFKMYYESEILQKHLIDRPEGFFRHLYSNILHKDHNHFNRHLMASSTSQSVLMPFLELLNVDILLSMKEEKDNLNLVRKIQGNESYFPIIFYRSLTDMKNNEHALADIHRAFPRIGWKEEDILKNFKKYKTNFGTLEDWYKKLGISDEKLFDYDKSKISFSELLNLVKTSKVTKNKALSMVARHLHEFIEGEGEFLELASKEMKLDLEESNSKKILSCLNTPSRIGIIKILDKGNVSAFEISKQIKVSLPTTLFHLSKMQEAGIIARNKNKTYSLKTNRFTLYA